MTLCGTSAPSLQADQRYELYISSLGLSEAPQSADDAKGDAQLNSIITWLSHEIDRAPEGTIIDVGCGEGVLLAALARIPAFQRQVGWHYCGADSLSVNRRECSRMFPKRVAFTTLDIFYKQWPERSSLPSPHVVFVRNVLHELTVDQTAELLYHLARHMRLGEVLVVQDLTVLPKAELHHCCWIPALLIRVIEKCGFKATLCPLTSKRGAEWFNVIATRQAYVEPPVSDFSPLERITGLLVEALGRQFQHWERRGALTSADMEQRGPRLARLDYTLQLAALYRRLRETASAVAARVPASTGAPAPPGIQPRPFDPCQAVRYAEEADLTLEPGPVVRELLRALATTTDPGERYWIYVTLGRIGGRHAEQALESGIKEEENLFARDGASDGLDLLRRNQDSP